MGVQRIALVGALLAVSCATPSASRVPSAPGAVVPPGSVSPPRIPGDPTQRLDILPRYNVAMEYRCEDITGASPPYTAHLRTSKLNQCSFRRWVQDGAPNTLSLLVDTVGDQSNIQVTVQGLNRSGTWHTGHRHAARVQLGVHDGPLPPNAPSRTPTRPASHTWCESTPQNAAAGRIGDCAVEVDANEIYARRRGDVVNVRVRVSCATPLCEGGNNNVVCRSTTPENFTFSVVAACTVMDDA